MQRHVVFSVAVFLAVAAARIAAGQMCVVENDCFRWEIGADGRNAHFIDKATGADCLAADGNIPFSRIRLAGALHDATAAAVQGDTLRVRFGDIGVEAVLEIDRKPSYVVLKVLSVSDPAVEELAILDVPLALRAALDEPFSACALALDLQTNVNEIPGPNSRLRALCYSRFGIPGAEVAIVATPGPKLRDALKEAVAAAPELPHHKDASLPPVGGPWALDAPINRGSYLFDFGALTEETVDKWIDLVKSLGLNQIDFHTGTSLRFGDCEPNAKLFPNGRASVKAVLDKLHAAGISAGLHTYAFFMAKNSRYVTPIPDPRLGKDATFTLAAPIDAAADTVAVNESTADVTLATAFFIRNSVTLHIDDELITFSGVTKEAPFTFTGCTRGACGTTPAPHAAGAKAFKLKECFGLFAPDPDSTLLAEVAANAADTFNECGFDMMYLDALDGEDVLAGSGLSWHYGSKFVYEIANRLERPALFEMSTFHHHLWCVRARLGAWDHPARAHKQFINIHCEANQGGALNYLPMNLGWWAVKTWQDGVAALCTEPTFPDDIEYLMGKALGNNMGISLMGVNPDNIGSVPAYQRLAPLFRNYEDLRHAGYFRESILARLREPGAEFTLESAPGGAWRLRPARYARHKVESAEPWSSAWTMKNEFAAQPARLRIESLMSAAPATAPETAVVEDFAAPDALPDRAAADGVTATLAADTEATPDGAPAVRITASSTRTAPAGSWAKFRKACAPALNIAAQPAFGVWVKGDGSGAVLNVQVLSSPSGGAGGIGDHYIDLDFTGWRYFALLEIESTRIPALGWPYGGAYAVYREHVDFGAIESFSLWCNNVPPGGTASCLIGPIKALPIAKSRVVNPAVTINGETITFPVEIESGAYLEYRAMEDCILYDAQGQELARVTPQGQAPTLQPGDNQVGFACAGADNATPRARVTVATIGAPLEN